MEILSIPELDTEPAQEPQDFSPRTPPPNCLPDGTPLRLSAGIVLDLATLFADEFSVYYPQRADEFAFLLFMAANPPEVWRGGKPSLMGDFGQFRDAVMEWVDANFRVSEAPLIQIIGLNLWLYHNGKRVTVVEEEQKKTTGQAGENLTTPTH